MGSGQDVAASIGGHPVEKRRGGVAHLGGGPVGKQVLRIDATHEGDLRSEFTLQFERVHAGAVALHGVEHIEADLDEALAQGLTPLLVINDHLLAGMKTVGELFASGEMQLPFVLGSAETMKSAVSYLEPFMDKADQGGKGLLVLATVKGDVHDIGKNLVDIILTNNGYTVRNLGIKIGIAEMVAAVEEFGADAIGMSGLLVKSTLIMRENL